MLNNSFKELTEEIKRSIHVSRLGINIENNQVIGCKDVSYYPENNTIYNHASKKRWIFDSGKSKVLKILNII
jgi:hypothetical protein